MELCKTLSKIFYGNEMNISKCDGLYKVASYYRPFDGYSKDPSKSDGNHFIITKDGEIKSGNHHKITESSNGNTNLRTVTLIPYENDDQFIDYLNTVELDVSLMEEYSKKVEEMEDGERIGISI